MKDYVNSVFLFVDELLSMIDDGKSIRVEDACTHIEEGNIIQFIGDVCGYNGNNVKKGNGYNQEIIDDINQILKKKDVSQDESLKHGIEENGLIYIVSILLEDWHDCLFNLESNDISVEGYRT